MPDTVKLPLDAVRRHAGSVDNVSAEVATAHQAANQVYLDVGAFGQLCSFVPALFDPVLRSSVEAIEDASATLRDTAGKLRFVADLTEAVDQANAQNVQNAGNQQIQLPL